MDKNKTIPELIPIKDAGGYLGGISKPVVYKLIASGDLETVKIGGRRFVTTAQITACISRLTVASKPKA